VRFNEHEFYDKNDSFPIDSMVLTSHPKMPPEVVKPLQDAKTPENAEKGDFYEFSAADFDDSELKETKFGQSKPTPHGRGKPGFAVFIWNLQ
jgi:hypothetical protein